MGRTPIAFSAGFIFGLGLLISRMVDPAKVLNFLNFTIHWDASLAFVMIGGILAAAIAFAIARKLDRPWFDTSFPTLPRNEITPRLVLGAGLFGIGWGLVGMCPGPALVALTLAPLRIAPFVLATFAGLWAVRRLTSHRSRVIADEAKQSIRP